MYVLYGAKTGDLETAKSWAVEVTGLAAEKRENMYSGDYYRLGAWVGEHIKIVSGTSHEDDGDYPKEADFPNWTLLVYLDNTSADSKLLKALDAAPHRFQKLRTT